MIGVLSTSSPSPFLLTPTLPKATHFASPIFIFRSHNHQNPRSISTSPLKPLKRFDRRGGAVLCSSNGAPGSGSGENDSKVVLDAFFLGKAFAEALNERIGSTVGEVLSVVGQWQAEQQKQVQDFQEEVLVRARKAKEKAALAVMEDQSLISKPSITTPGAATPATPSSSGGPTTEDPFQAMLKD